MRKFESEEPLTGLPAVLGAGAAFELIEEMRSDEQYVLEHPRPDSASGDDFDRVIGGESVIEIVPDNLSTDVDKRAVKY